MVQDMWVASTRIFQCRLTCPPMRSLGAAKSADWSWFIQWNELIQWATHGKPAAWGTATIIEPRFAIIDTDHYSKSRISSTCQRKPASMDADTADIKGFQLSQGKNKCSLFSSQTNVCLYITYCTSYSPSLQSKVQTEKHSKMIKSAEQTCHFGHKTVQEKDNVRTQKCISRDNAREPHSNVNFCRTK